MYLFKFESVFVQIANNIVFCAARHLLITNHVQHTPVFHLCVTSALSYSVPRLISSFLNIHAFRLNLFMSYFFKNIDIEKVGTLD